MKINFPNQCAKPNEMAVEETSESGAHSTEHF